MATKGRAELLREPDDQYTYLIFTVDEAGVESFQSSTSNLTLTNAFNGARDALAALATGNNKHQRIHMTTVIYP
jgi:hypothetical protein